MPRIKKVVDATALGTASQEPAASTESVKEEATISVSASLLEQLQKQIQDQGKELQNLKKGQKPEVGKAERYEGPRSRSVSFWTTKDGARRVVTDWRLTKFDPRFDLTYKNQYGQHVDNQAMELIYDDGSKDTVGHYDYGMNLVRSEKLFPVGTEIKKDMNGKAQTFFIFDIDGSRVAVSERATNQ